MHLFKYKAAFRLNQPTFNCQLESWAGALVSQHAVRTIYTRRIEDCQAELRSCVRVEVAVSAVRPNEPSGFRGRKAIY